MVMVVRMPYLSPNFTIEELSITQQVDRVTGQLLGNIPGPIESLYLRILCETILEPIRTIWKNRIKVNSGYRSLAVELAVSGKDWGQHRKGQAADIIPMDGLDLDVAYQLVWASALPYDQLLLEGVGNHRWIHVSCAPLYYRPRREALVSPNGHQWVVYNPQNVDGHLA